MICFETGLHDFLIEARVTLVVLAAGRILDLAYELFPEYGDSINSFLNHEAQSVWSELKMNHLEAAFSLFGYSIIICLLILTFENIFFYIFTLFAVSLFSS
jgi:hypothetical protein